MRLVDGVLWNVENEVNITKRDELSEMQQRELEEVLGQYPHVFKELNGLPLVRQINHAITLQPGSGPVSVRPYRYPHYQKDEIE